MLMRHGGAKVKDTAQCCTTHLRQESEAVVADRSTARLHPKRTVPINSGGGDQMQRKSCEHCGPVCVVTLPTV